MIPFFSAKERHYLNCLSHVYISWNLSIQPFHVVLGTEFSSFGDVAEFYICCFHK
uniref:Uncharacterized protein n=1 Tax=Arundo donax TaxID=35708 RepID=A0A0A9H882_ARUDO